MLMSLFSVTAFYYDALYFIYYFIDCHYDITLTR